MRASGTWILFSVESEHARNECGQSSHSPSAGTRQSFLYVASLHLVANGGMVLMPTVIGI